MTCSSTQDSGTCEYTILRYPKIKQRMQTTVSRRYAESSATKLASQSMLLTSRWLTGWDSGVPVNAADIEMAHRVGQRSSTESRPIIVRFFDCKKRDKVLSNRRSLKRKVFVVGEDLTYANYQMSKKAMEHSATLAVWSSNGRILAKIKNGRIVRLKIHTDERGVQTNYDFNCDERC